MTPRGTPVPCDVTILDDVLRRAFSGRRKRLSNALKQLELEKARRETEEIEEGLAALSLAAPAP